MNIENKIQEIYETLSRNKWKLLIGSAIMAGLGYYLLFVNKETKLEQKQVPVYNRDINYVLNSEDGK